MYSPGTKLFRQLVCKSPCHVGRLTGVPPPDAEISGHCEDCGGRGGGVKNPKLSGIEPGPMARIVTPVELRAFSELHMGSANQANLELGSNTPTLPQKSSKSPFGVLLLDNFSQSAPQPGPRAPSLTPFLVGRVALKSRKEKKSVGSLILTPKNVDLEIASTPRFPHLKKTRAHASPGASSSPYRVLGAERHHLGPTP